MAINRDFAPVFAELRAILAPYAQFLDVIHDQPGYYYLNTRTLGANKRPIAFGGVRVGKNYVSYYLMPAYTGHVKTGLSPAMKKRMQGKACFNFTAVDPMLFDQLRELTQRGYEAWREIKWVE